MSVMTDILDEEILADKSYRYISRLKKYKGYTLRRDPLSKAYELRIAANSRLVCKLLYDRDLVKEDMRKAALSRTLKEIHEALLSSQL